MRYVFSSRPLIESLESRVFLSATPNEATQSASDQSLLLGAGDTYSLLVNNGTGSGTYHAGDVVALTAAAPPQAGLAFYNWTGESTGLANPFAGSTTFIMPAANVTLTANSSEYINHTSNLREGLLTGYTDVMVDDAHLVGGSDAIDGSGENINLRSGQNPIYQIGLLGIKDLFNQIPQTYQGRAVSIVSAKLHLFRYQGVASDVITINRVKTDWLTGAAGTNESDVSFKHRDVSSNLHWASGGDFSASDYDSSGVSSAWSDVYDADVMFNITSLLQSIYTTGNNYGLVIRSNSAGGDAFRSSENTKLHPYIEIVYAYGEPTPMHYLTVSGGTATGSVTTNEPGYFWENQPVTIAANAPASGKIFNLWYGDVGYHNNFTTLTKDCTPFAQSQDITPSGTIEVGDKFILTADGETLTVISTGTTVNSACRDIQAAINAAGSGSVFYRMTASLMTSNNIASAVTLLAKTPGVGWELTLSTQEANGSAGDHQLGLYTRIANHVPPASNIAAANSTYQMPAYDATITSTYRDTTQPLDWWPTFDAFCQSSFGAEKEPLTYEYANTNYGSSSLAFLSTGQYIYASENSAYLGYETILPAKTRLEYGTTTAYGTTISHNARYNYEHGYDLAGLSKGVTYYYRLTATDERGNSITTTGSVTAATPSESGKTVRYIDTYSATSDWAVTLNQANSLYVLRTDITANKGGIRVTASNITLDLNGHTIIYDNATGAGVTPDANAPAGVNTYQVSALLNIKIFNGTIKQGLGYHGSDSGSQGYSPIIVKSTNNVTIAGMYLEYAGSQMSGIMAGYASGLFHHNTLLDRGAVITNRMALFAALNIGGNCTVNNNLVLRTRHGGVYSGNNSGNTIFNNEIYTDSSDTNSIGIGSYHSTGWNVYNNHVFGSGYELRGISLNSQTSGFQVHNNFVHLRAQDLDYRSAEYAALSEVSGIDCRWSCFDNTIEANYFVVSAQDKGEAQAIWYNSDQADPANGRQATHNIKYFNNVVKGTYFNEDSTKLAALRITGSGVQFADGGETDIYGRPIRQVYFSGNRIISNFANVGFGALGEMYIKGMYAYFAPYDSNNDGAYEYGGNTFEKDTSIAHAYNTIRIDGGSNNGHQFFDSTLTGGADFNSVEFISSNSTTWFEVGWTLTLYTHPGAAVTIKDVTGATVFTGTADANGVVSQQLIQYRQYPTSRTYFAPYTVSAVSGGITQAKTINMTATTSAAVHLLEGDANADGKIDGADLLILNTNWDPLGITSQNWPHGDFNFDGKIDGADLLILNMNWSPLGYSETSDLPAITEPTLAPVIAKTPTAATEIVLSASMPTTSAADDATVELAIMPTTRPQSLTGAASFKPLSPRWSRIMARASTAAQYDASHRTVLRSFQQSPARNDVLDILEVLKPLEIGI